MPDLLDDLRSYAGWIDDLAEPVTGEEARRRTADTSAVIPLAVDAAARRRPWLLVAAAAVGLVVLIGAALAWVGGDDDASLVDVGPPPTTAPSVATTSPPQIRSHTIPEAPVDYREGAVEVWTGRFLVVWGGSRPDIGGSMNEPLLLDDGWRYDATDQSWEAMAAAPLSGRSEVIGAWTGEEVVVLGGHNGTDLAFSDAAAYNPMDDTWRRIADPPFTGTSAAIGLEDGRVLVYAPTRGGLLPPALYQPDHVATYDPATDRWEEVVDPPMDLERVELVSIGDDILAWGAGSVPGSPDGMRGDDTFGQLRYHPAEDRWSGLPDRALAWLTEDAIWTPRGLLSAGWSISDAGGQLTLRLWDPVTDQVEELAPPSPAACPLDRLAIHLTLAGDQVRIHQCEAIHYVGLADLGEAVDSPGTPVELEPTRLLSTVDGVTLSWGLRWETPDAIWPDHVGLIEVVEPAG